jgi:predicted glutamine amidotransferase
VCIIFVKRADQEMSSDWIAGMRNKGNRDGAGVMWCDPNSGQVFIEKISATALEDDVRKLYEKHQDKDIAFHVRNKTKGEINLDNVHPFWVTRMEDGDPRDIAMMHNGTIQDIQVEPTMCDSYNLAVHFLRPILKKDPDWIDDEDNMRLLTALVGKSRLVFLDGRGQFTVVNSGEGYYLDVAGGIWCSRREKDINPLPPIQSRTTSSTTSSSASTPFTPPVAPVHLLPPSNISPPTYTGPKTPAQLGSFVPGADGVKCFRLSSSASAASLMTCVEEAKKDEEDEAQAALEPDNEQIDLESLSMLTKEQILHVVVNEPEEVAALLHGVGQSYREVIA